jgi:LPXTG-motif cell wall-anchored protein
VQYLAAATALLLLAGFLYLRRRRRTKADAAPGDGLTGRSAIDKKI